VERCLIWQECCSESVSTHGPARQKEVAEMVAGAVRQYGELGDLLLRAGEVAPGDLDNAQQLLKAARSTKLLEDILVEQGFCSAEVIDRACRALIEMRRWRASGEWAPY
jgi:hypothetical protein